MPRFFYLCKTKRSKKTINKKKKMNLNIFSKFKYINLYSLVFILIIVTGIGYLLVANNTAIKGFEVKELENRITDLEDQNTDLELETIKLQSINVVEDKVNQSDMVKVAKIDYVSPTGSAVALAQE